MSSRTMRAKRRAARKRQRVILWAGLAGAILVVVGAFIVFAPNLQRSVLTQYEAGRPGAGDPAPEFSLPKVGGGTFSLSDYRGQKNVLLFFQEGVG